MRTMITSAHLSFAVLAMSAVAACSGGAKDAASDRAAVTSDTAAGTMSDSMAGVDHSKMPGMSTTPAKDADQEFLRVMVDHHEGMTQMLDPALQKASSQTAKADAKKVHDKQHQEQEQLVAMLKRSYNETKQPMVTQNDQSMVDDLKNSPAGAAFDKKMYEHMVMHHQAALQMIDQFLPRLTKPELKQMAEKMRADQQKEIQEFQRKAS